MIFILKTMNHHNLTKFLHSVANVSGHFTCPLFRYQCLGYKVHAHKPNIKLLDEQKLGKLKKQHKVPQKWHIMFNIINNL